VVGAEDPQLVGEQLGVGGGGPGLVPGLPPAAGEVVAGGQGVGVVGAEDPQQVGEQLERTLGPSSPAAFDEFLPSQGSGPDASG